MDLYHGSSEKIGGITPEGLFGGVFANDDPGVARAHGKIVHLLTPQRPLEDFELNYTLDWEAVRAALDDVVGEDEEVRAAVLDRACPDVESLADPATDPGGTWAVQRLRGELAAALGFDAVEIEDEHGTSWLCLPGCLISPVDEG